MADFLISARVQLLALLISLVSSPLPQPSTCA